MNAPMHGWWLFADDPRWRAFGSAFRGESARIQVSDVLMILGIIALVALAVWGLSWLLMRSEGERRAYSPRKLFAQLCRAHGLDRAQRRLLKRVARHHGLTMAAQLFVEPHRFEGLELVLADQREALATLRATLFASPPAETLGKSGR